LKINKYKICENRHIENWLNFFSQIFETLLDSLRDEKSTLKRVPISAIEN
jgi:hypothetical protein